VSHALNHCSLNLINFVLTFITTHVHQNQGAVQRSHPISWKQCHKPLASNRITSIGIWILHCITHNLELQDSKFLKYTNVAVLFLQSKPIVQRGSNTFYSGTLLPSNPDSSANFAKSCSPENCCKSMEQRQSEIKMKHNQIDMYKGRNVKFNREKTFKEVRHLSNQSYTRITVRNYTNELYTGLFTGFIHRN